MNSLLAIVFLVLLSSSYIGSTPLSRNGSHVCAGCPVENDPLKVSPKHRSMIEKYYNQHSVYRGFIKRFTKASTQVVAGLMYRYEFELVTTNCEKGANCRDLNRRKMVS